MHKKYQKQLLAEKVVKEDDLKRMQEHVSSIMSKEFEAARDYKPEVCFTSCRKSVYGLMPFLHLLGLSWASTSMPPLTTFISCQSVHL